MPKNELFTFDDSKTTSFKKHHADRFTYCSCEAYVWYNRQALLIRVDMIALVLSCAFNALILSGQCSAVHCTAVWCKTRSGKQIRAIGPGNLTVSETWEKVKAGSQK